MDGQSDRTEQNNRAEQNTNANTPRQPGTQNQNGGGFQGFTGLFFPIFGERPPASNENNSQQEAPREAQFPQIQVFVYPISGTQGGDGQTTPGVFFFTPFFMMPQQEVSKPRASESAIKGLPIITMTKELVDLQASCPICLEPFPLTDGQEENQKSQNAAVRQMPCNHMFCESCLFQWLRQNNSCPLCRKEIEAEGTETQQNDNNGTTTNVHPNVPIFGMMNISSSPPVSPPVSPSSNAAQSQSNSQTQNSRPRSSCDLESVGCCEETDKEAPMPIITLPQCHHRFHASCLRTSLLIEGYSQGDFNSISQPLNFRCPTCRSPAIVQSDMLKMPVTPHNERQEQEVLPFNYFNITNDMDLD